jgi:hypothetical protein
MTAECGIFAFIPTVPRTFIFRIQLLRMYVFKLYYHNDNYLVYFM